MGAIADILKENEEPKNECDIRADVLNKKLEAEALYKHYMTIGMYEMALFFLARGTAFEECMRLL